MQEINEMRARIASIRAAMRGLASDRILKPEAELLASIDEFMETAGATGRELLTRGADYAVMHGSVPLGLNIWNTGNGEQVAGLLAALAPKAMRDALREQVRRRVAEAPATMTDAAREARIAELQAELLDAEKVEYAAVEAARQKGQRIDHRADCDPRVLLGVA
jgi:hypothetical protein